MLTINEEDLKLHNGERGSRLWIAESGIVYDVTDCPKWRTGMHEQLHFPGLDLSNELPEAPHSSRCFLPTMREGRGQIGVAQSLPKTPEARAGARDRRDPHPKAGRHRTHAAEAARGT